MPKESPNYWVTRTDDGSWKTSREGADRAAGIFATQAEAATRGRELAIASHGELIIQDRHGRIRSKDSYGPDSPRRVDNEH